MQILRHTGNAPADMKGAIMALGNFDGVHRGHRALIAEARRIADEEGRKLGAIVFEPYPREYFRPGGEAFRLTPLHEKARLLAACGVEILVVLDFNAALAGRLAQDFVSDILLQELAVAHVVVGADFRFGKGRAGDAAVLAYMGEMEGFGVTVFPAVSEGGEKISSSKVRDALKAGRPNDAARLLGQWWSIQGVVVAGDKRGRTLGFPTANLKLTNTLAPAFGVYAVRVRRGDGEKIYDGVANFGIRPMFEIPEPLLEIYLFDFSGDLYGERLTVDFVAYLRGEENFGDLASLKARIAADCEAAQAALARLAPP